MEEAVNIDDLYDRLMETASPYATKVALSKLKVDDPDMFNLFKAKYPVVGCLMVEWL